MSRITEVRCKARRLLLKLGLESTCPIPLSAIAKRLGVSVRYIDTREIDGIAMCAGSRSIILLKRTPFRTRLRFTLAHELAHVVLKHPLSFSFSSPSLSIDNALETEANIWASEILMPLNPIRRLGHFHAEADLARMFNVSQEAMHWRLQGLGIK